MTIPPTIPNELLPTQADRDAAADITINIHRNQMRSGRWDHDPVVQAFARHAVAARLSTEAAIVAWLRAGDDGSTTASRGELADAIEQERHRG